MFLSWWWKLVELSAKTEIFEEYNKSAWYFFFKLIKMADYKLMRHAFIQIEIRPSPARGSSMWIVSKRLKNRLASFTTILWKSVFSNNAYLFKLRFVKIWSSAIWVEILERLAQCRRFQRVFQIQFFVNIELLVFVIPVITRQSFKKCHKMNVPLSVGNNTRCWSWWIVCRLMVIDFRRVLDHFRILQCICKCLQ